MKAHRPQGPTWAGSGSLTLGAVTTSTRRLTSQPRRLDGAPSAVLETGTGTLSLSAGTNPDGSSATAGVLTIATGAVVASENYRR